MVFLAFVITSPTVAFGLYEGTDGTPTTPSPTLFTSQSGRDEVTKYSGAYTKRLPLDIPPGRNGLQPEIALEYNSQNTADSLVGYGWQLSIPYVERLNKTGSEKLYTDNYFSSSLGGELATTTASTTEYFHKVEDGRFLSYSFANNSWVAYDKSGTRYTFGGSSQSRQFDAATSSNVTKWMIEEIRDPNDNFVRFVYLKDNNEIYPSQILYTGNASSDGPMTVTFSTSTRSDPYVRYVGGVKVTTNYRITEIKAWVNSTWVRKHTLSYTTGNNGVRSMLSSIQTTGKDADNTELSLPATTFTYTNSTASFVTTASPEVKNISYVVTDVNGNGMSDVSAFYFDQFSSTYKGYIKYDDATESNFSDPPRTWANLASGASTYTPVESGNRFFDVNGDGWADVVRGNQNAQLSVFDKYIYLASTTTARTWTSVASSTWSGDVPAFSYTTNDGVYVLTTGVLGELNGDGITDYVTRVTSYVASEAHIGTGLGWVATSTIFSPIGAFPGPGGTPMYNNQLIDINGDGLDDWVNSTLSSTTQVRLNTGTGWEVEPDSRWTLASSTFYGSAYWDRGMRFIDINGDGLVDFVRSYKMPSYTCGTCSPGIEVGQVKLAFLNTGSGWATTTAITFPTPYITEGFTDGSNQWAGDLRFNEYIPTGGRGQKNQDVLTGISLPTGGSIAIEYAETGGLATHASLPVSLLVVSKVTTNDNNGNAQEVNYTYQGGAMYFAEGVRERKLAGFGVVSEQSPLGITKTYFHQGNAASTTVGELTDHRALIGRTYREEVLSPSGSTLRKTFNRLETADLGNGRTFAYRAAESVQDWEGGTSHKDRATEYTYSTSTGEVLQIVEKGEVTGSTDGTYSDTGSDARFTSLSYAVATSTNLTVPTSKVLKNNASTTVQETKFYYDGQAFGSTTKGNRTKDEFWISGSTYASTTKTFNQYGLVSTSTDARGATTTFAYDAVNLYPATTTNALNQVTGYLYDYATGKPTLVRDANNLVRTTTFDPVGRVSVEKQPDLSTPSTLVTSKEYTYTDDVFPSSIRTRSYFSSGTSTDGYVYRDGVGRTIQERGQVATSTYVVKDYVFNTTGLLTRESLPYFATSSARSVATSTSALFTTTGFDALQRATTTSNNVGTTTFAYTPWKTRITDALGNYKDTNFDAFRNLASVAEYNDAEVGTTTYSYDAIGNLASTTDALGNVRTFTYDGLSRRLTAQDVHDTADGTFGTWTYAYDRAGNIASTTDPKGQRIDYTYDALNRVTAEDYTGSAGTEVSYLYDFCTYGKGKLCVASSTEAYTSTAYNALGLVSGEAKRINGTAHASTTFDYDRQGNATTITYPDGRVVQNGYDVGGHIADIKTRTAAGSFSDVLTRATYAAHGQPALRRYGNSVEIPYTYYTDQLYRLQQIGSAASSTGSGYSLDLERGSTQYAAITDGSQTGLDFSDALSFAEWVNFESTPSNGQRADLVSKRLSTGSNRSYWFTLQNEGGLSLRLVTWTNGASSGCDVTVSWSPSTASWYHVAVTKSGTTVKFYVNGSQQGTTQTCSNATVYNGTAAFEVGNYSEDNESLDGKVDDLRVWSRAVSATEVSDLYSSPSSFSNGANLQGWWALDNAYTDASGNGNTLTGQGSPVFSTEVPPTTANGDVQSISYTYDAIGNITGISDLSNTLARKTMEFTYDDLYRLLTASTTAATSTPFREVYRYNALGNVLYKGNGLGSTTQSTNTHSLDLEVSSNQYASIADGSQTGLDFSDEFTLSGWVRFESLQSSDDDILIAKRYATGNNRSYSFFSTGSGSENLSLVWWTTGSSVGGNVQVSWSPTTATWYHVAVTKSGTSVKFYVNGAQQGTTQTGSTAGVYDSAAEFRLGADQDDAADDFDGLIDDVRVWSRALSASEMSDLYSSPGSFSNGSSLQGWWGLDSAYIDSSGNSNTLTGQGSPVFSSTVPYSSGATTVFPNTYAYDETNYANPHAPTGIWLGYATSTLVYDASGNVTQNGTTTAYTYDYRNRMNAAGVLGATSTYGYDHTQQRMRQTLSNGTRTDYPNKFYSITSTTTGATTTATSTAYIWQGDTLVAYIEQLLINGVASGTPQMYFTHPDHLGSTNVVTNASGTVVQTLDYYPYGSARIDTGSADSARKFIGQFADDPTALSYLNARYYDPGRAGFLSEDPVFWEVGQTEAGRNIMTNPQALNSYAYANGNPIINKDPTGRCVGPLAAACAPLILGGTGFGLGIADVYLGDVLENQRQGASHPYTQNLSSPQTYAIGGLSGIATMLFLPESAAISGGSAFVTSIAQDLTEGRDPNVKGALVQAGTAVATRGIFKNTVGKLASREMRLRSEIAQGVFGTASGIVVQNRTNLPLNRVNPGPTSRSGGAAPSTWGGSAVGLPSVVKQGGTTYVRNASGLLNIAP